MRPTKLPTPRPLSSVSPSSPRACEAGRAPFAGLGLALSALLALSGCETVSLDEPPARPAAAPSPAGVPAAPVVAAPAAPAADEPAADVQGAPVTGLVTVPVPRATVDPPGPAASAPAAALAVPAAPAAASAPQAPLPVDADTLLRFTRWVDDFRGTARAAGIDDATIRLALDDVHYLPRVVDADRAQPEFTRAVWDYLDRAVAPARVAQGRDKLAEVRPLAEAAASRYGVPPAVLVAIWGMESRYGGDFGDIPTVDALATLGFEGRREDWARGQLVAALKILQHGDIDRAHMIGSWAGAMGQTQFLPSTYLAVAVDGDGDGRRDIWGSMADVLSSTANFLARAGWRGDEPWGVELQLPPGFDVSRADPAVRQSSAQWNADGVRTVDGAPLPPMDDASVLLPAGARGPAFLVGADFRAILRYNNSSSYALAVGLLAQQIDGGPGVRGAWPRDLVTLTRSQMLALQGALNAAGFPCGTPDGLMGPSTRSALRQWQRSVGRVPDGYPTLDQLQQLQPGVVPGPVPAPVPPLAPAPVPAPAPVRQPAPMPLPSPQPVPAPTPGQAPVLPMSELRTPPPSSRS